MMCNATVKNNRQNTRTIKMDSLNSSVFFLCVYSCCLLFDYIAQEITNFIGSSYTLYTNTVYFRLFLFFLSFIFSFFRVFRMRR